MKPPKIYLKKADFSDAEFLWHLRNQPDVFRYSRQNKKVEWGEHINWMASVVLGQSNKVLFVIKNQNLPIGQIRFDFLDEKEAEVSIAVLNDFRGKGLAQFAFKKGLSEVLKEKKLETLKAVINEENRGSVAFFEKLKFEFKDKKGSWLQYYLHL